MTLEEADKKIVFILQMQAQFESNIGKLRDSQATLTASVVDIAGVLRDSVRISDERFTRLAEAQRAADERMVRFDDRMIELAEAQKATDDRLNTLIHVVERHIIGPDHSPQPQ
jgi:hypothetical protein